MPGVPRRSEFQFLKQGLADFIKLHSDLIIGAGIAYAPGSLPEAPHWLEWWRAQPKGGPRFVTHDLNPDSLNYYDYTGREWFTLPVLHRAAGGSGPLRRLRRHQRQHHHPLRSRSHRAGHPCPRMRPALAKLEGVFLRALQLREPAVVLLGPNGRVIASNNARIATGTLLLDEDLTRADHLIRCLSRQPHPPALEAHLLEGLPAYRTPNRRRRRNHTPSLRTTALPEKRFGRAASIRTGHQIGSKSYCINHTMMYL